MAPVVVCPAVDWCVAVHTVCGAASSPAAPQDQAPFSRLFNFLSLVVVVADADDAGHVVFVFLVIGKEGVIVVAEIDIVIFIVKRDVFCALGLVVGILQRDDLRCAVFSIEFL